MPWCPNCKTQYRDGFLECSDCGAILVDELPENKEEKLHVQPETPTELCFLTSVVDGIQAKLIENLLHGSGIPFLSKDRECGAYLKIYMGFSKYGTDIYVDRSNYNKARELIEAYFTESDNCNKNKPLFVTGSSLFSTRKEVMRIFILINLLFVAGFLIYGIINSVLQLL